MKKNNIEKLDEQIQSLLDMNKGMNEKKKNDNHVIFVDRLSSDNHSNEDTTRRIDKIDDVKANNHQQDSCKIDKSDEKVVAYSERQLDDDNHANFGIILVLILIILILCIILFLFF